MVTIQLYNHRLNVIMQLQFTYLFLPDINSIEAKLICVVKKKAAHNHVLESDKAMANGKIDLLLKVLQKRQASHKFSLTVLPPLAFGKICSISSHAKIYLCSPKQNPQRFFASERISLSKSFGI